MPKLIFGDQKSIKLRDKAEIDNIWNRLKKEITCPLCNGKANDYYGYDLIEGWIAINFDCKSYCDNSMDKSAKVGPEQTKTIFIFEGKCLD